MERWLNVGGRRVSYIAYLNIKFEHTFKSFVLANIALTLHIFDIVTNVEKFIFATQDTFTINIYKTSSLVE